MEVTRPIVGLRSVVRSAGRPAYLDRVRQRADQPDSARQLGSHISSGAKVAAAPVKSRSEQRRLLGRRGVSEPTKHETGVSGVSSQRNNRADQASLIANRERPRDDANRDGNHCKERPNPTSAERRRGSGSRPFVPWCR